MLSPYNKILTLIILLFLSTTSQAQKSNQLKLRRDVLLMVDSIEMAYSRACPEIPLKTIDPKSRKADELAIKKLNRLYYDSSSYLKYQSNMVQKGFYYKTTEDKNGLKRATFLSTKGNLSILIQVEYLLDSITNRQVFLETHSHISCYTKSINLVFYIIDIFYIRGLAPLINFPFTISLAEPTFSKDDVENE